MSQTYTPLDSLPSSSLASNSLIPVQDNVSGTNTNRQTTVAALAAAISVGSTLPTLSGDVTNTGNAVTLKTVNSNVGSFTNPVVTVNGKGLVTAVTGGTAPVTGTSPIAVTGTAPSNISMQTSGVVPGNYTSANLTVDSFGRITAASNGSGSGGASIISQTYSQMQTLISTSALVPGQMYYVTDKNVILTALSSTQLKKEGTYLYTSGKKAWGAFKITGTSGNVSSITINGGSNLLTSTQTYANTKQLVRINPGWSTAPSVDISLITLAQNIAANLNANSAFSSSYKAYALGTGDTPLSGVGSLGQGYVIIQAIATGTAVNGYTIAVTASSLTCSSVIAMQGGVADLSSPLLYACKCDCNASTFTLLSLYDAQYDNEVAYDEKTIVADVSANFFDFNWNNSLVVNNKLVNCTISPNFILAGSSNYSGGMAIIGNDLVHSSFGTNLIISGEMSFNKVTAGLLNYNIVNGTSAGISGNKLTGMIDGYYLSNTQSDISYCYITNMAISNNTLTYGGSIRYCAVTVTSGYGISDNQIGFMCCMWNVSNWTAVKSNQMRARYQMVNIIASNYSIFGQNEMTDDGILNDLTCSGTMEILNNKLLSCVTMGDGTIIASTPVQQSWSNVLILSCQLAGNYLDNNTLSNINLFHANGVDLAGITLTPANAIWLGGEGVPGAGKFTIDINITAFDAANIGSILTHSLLNIQGTNCVIGGGYVYASGLTTSGSPTIALGLATTNNAIMSATSTSTLNTGDGSHGTGRTILPITLLATTTANFQPVTMTIANGAISAGSLVIHLDCFSINI